MASRQALTADIRLVAEVVSVDGGLRITFGDGSSAVLEATHPNFDGLRINVESRRGAALPVGVVLDGAGQVGDLYAAHDTAVRYILEDPADDSRLTVAFWGFSPICYLTRDHQDFERLRRTLAAVAGTNQRVWFANHSEMMVTEPAGGVEGETWWKLMDVRPA
jgi:hypothetical protein